MPKGIAFKIDDEFHKRLRILLIKNNKKLTQLVKELLGEWVQKAQEREDAIQK